MSIIFVTSILAILSFLTPLTLYADQIDQIAPVIVHNSPEEGYHRGLDIRIKAIITDNVKVTTVTLYYREESQVKYIPLEMTHKKGDQYIAVIPVDATQGGKVEYYIEAMDKEENITLRGLPISPLVIRISDEKKRGIKKAVLLIAEQTIGQRAFFWWWGVATGEASLSTVETILGERLIEANIEVIDPSVMSGKLSVPKPYQHVNLSNREAMQLANTMGADIVVIGKALAREGGYAAGSDMRSVHASITARVVKVRTGKVLASVHGEGSSIHIDPVSGAQEALQDAANEVADAILAKIN